VTAGGVPPGLARRLYGTDEPPARRLPLRAGPLAAELVDGGIRRLAWNGVEIARGIAFLIRDDAWGTLPATLGEAVVEAGEDRFRATWDGTIGTGPDRFAFRARVDGDAAGSFSFALEGRPDADLTTNRAGFVILHPAGFAGLPVTLLGVDGDEAETHFPQEISPRQPFFDLRGLRYAPQGADVVTCRMEASLPLDPQGRFETEDQRNWCDASFKTYVGSLRDPWPYRLPAGSPFGQRVTIRIEPAPAAPAAPRPAASPSTVTAGRLPVFGIGVPHGAHGADPAQAAVVRRLGLPWMVVEADMRRGDVHAHLQAAAALCAGRAVQLEIVAPCARAPADELGDAARACAAAGLSPRGVLVVPAPLLRSFQPQGAWPDLPPLSAWYAAAREAFPEAAVGGGMMTNFTELNRRRPEPEGLAFIAHSTTAIVHDADDAAVMETLETLPHIGRSVAALWPGVPWHLGPSSIAMRSNPYGATAPTNPDWIRMPLADRDPRQRGLFGAAWTVGFAAESARSGAARVALHATHGHLGLADAGDLHPCFHVMAALARASGCSLDVLDVPEGMDALAWHGSGHRHALVANLTPEAVAMPVAGRGRVLDAEAMPAARGDPGWIDGPAAPLPGRLGPYAVAFVGS
jgi:D-apionolactonase